MNAAFARDFSSLLFERESTCSVVRTLEKIKTSSEKEAINLQRRFRLAQYFFSLVHLFSRGKMHPPRLIF